MNIITPLSIGFLGSLHCIGMCGPIALALPLGKYSGVKRNIGVVLYNLGRITTYSLIGLILGFLGRSFYMAGYQQQFSIFLGVMIIVGLLIPSILPKQGKLTSIWNKIFGKMYNELGALLKNGSFSSIFFIGVLNGFLPCGLVYLGLAGALAQTEIYDSISFMILFGLGTWPLMLSITWASKYVSLALRNRIKKLSPFFIAFFALILILRGLNLGIYLSPQFEAVGTFIQSCI